MEKGTEGSEMVSLYLEDVFVAKVNVNLEARIRKGKKGERNVLLEVKLFASSRGFDLLGSTKRAARMITFQVHQTPAKTW